jgi:hypothetical protein
MHRAQYPVQTTFCPAHVFQFSAIPKPWYYFYLQIFEFQVILQARKMIQHQQRRSQRRATNHGLRSPTSSSCGNYLPTRSTTRGPPHWMHASSY